MSFYFEPFSANGEIKEARQHIQLSLYAWSVIEADIRTFVSDDIGAEKRSFLNRIFRGMYQSNTAPANLTSAVHDQRELLNTALRRANSIPSNKLFDLLSEAYINTYTYSFDSTDATESYKLRIDHETNDIFSEMGTKSVEERVFQKLHIYLKEVFETYTRLSPAERERIYYWSLYAKIQAAIDQKHIITYQLDKEWRVKPLELIPDDYGQHYYLIGYECQESSATNHSRPFATRFTNIKSISDRAEKFKFKDSEIKAIKKDLVEKGGPAFLRNNLEEIRIKLTSNGMRQYNSITYLRPKYVTCEELTENPWRYRLTFLAPRHHICVYFEKFLGDALIESPVDLVNRFLEHYKKAYAVYQEAAEITKD